MVQTFSYVLRINKHLKMTGKGFYSKWEKSSFEHFITCLLYTSDAADE